MFADVGSDAATKIFDQAIDLKDARDVIQLPETTREGRRFDLFVGQEVHVFAAAEKAIARKYAPLRRTLLTETTTLRFVSFFEISGLSPSK